MWGKCLDAGQTFKVLVYIHITSCMYIFPFFDVCMYVCVYGVAGIVVVNDLPFQAATPYLPFGGVGHSGSGAYPVVSCSPNNSTIA